MTHGKDEMNFPLQNNSNLYYIESQKGEIV